MARRLQFYLARVASIHCEPAGPDIYGQVREEQSVLELIAPVIRTQLTGFRHTGVSIHFFNWESRQASCADSNALLTHLIGKDVWLACLERKRPEGRTLRGNDTGCSIVLHEIVKGTFKHVGLVENFSDSEGLFSADMEKAPRRTFRIV